MGSLHTKEANVLPTSSGEFVNVCSFVPSEPPSVIGLDNSQKDKHNEILEINAIKNHNLKMVKNIETENHNGCNAEPPMLRVSLQNSVGESITTRGLLDTGACVSVISEDWVKNHNLEIVSDEKELLAAGALSYSAKQKRIS